MRLTNSRCQCGDCGRYFSSTTTFAQHRASATSHDCHDPATVTNKRGERILFPRHLPDGTVWQGPKRHDRKQG